jgi:transposase
MEILCRRCCGLDIHKKFVMACSLMLGPDNQVTKEVRRFGTMTRDLLELADWLTQKGVTHVAMESTGVFWKPVYNIVEGLFEVILVNPRDIKQVPGRKTDVTDCAWIAQLLQYGLLRGSFIPPRAIRDLRDLTRHRAQWISEKARVVNRMHKVLEDANIKLGAVATDILGASGRDMIQAIIAGEADPEKLAQLARRRLRGKIPQLQLALEGKVREHHRFQLTMLWEQVMHLEKLMEQLDCRSEEVVSPFEAEIHLLMTHPGIKRHAAEEILAEIGTDMDQFPSSGHLASWACICPGNNASAGKNTSGKTRKGNRWLRRTLTQVAWAASRTKATYFTAQYRRLAARRGKKRAIVAVGHTILGNVYHRLKSGVPYHELGPDHFESRDADRLARYYVKRLERLGLDVTIEPQKAAA